MMNIQVSSVCHAFDPQGIGTRVILPGDFFLILEHEIGDTKFSEKGTALIELHCLDAVSAGVGLRDEIPEHYVCREHRGRVNAYLKREYAAKVESLSAVVYTLDAYLSDPDVQQDPNEIKRIKDLNPDYVIVAVLAQAGPSCPVTPYRFVHNMAGGNIEYQDKDTNELIALAMASLEYHNEWSVVAD